MTKVFAMAEWVLEILFEVGRSIIREPFSALETPQTDYVYWKLAF